MLSWANTLFQFKRNLSIFVSLSLATSPIAWAGGANQDLQIKIGNYLRNTNSEKPQTIGQWFKVAGKYMHAELANQVRPWIEKHANEPMPKIESVATTEGQKERVRLLIHDENKIINLDFFQQDGQGYMEFNGKKYTYDDLYYGDTIPQAFPADLVKTLTFDEFSRLAKNDMNKAVNYMTRIRGVVNALESLGGYFVTPADQKTSYIDFILETAYAAPLKEGAKCIVGGHISKMKNGSCGSGDDKVVTKDCGRDKIQCNSIVYGYKGRKEICVENKPAIEVSTKCDSKNILPGSARDMIIEILNVTNQDPSKKEAWEAYFETLEGQISGAAEACGKTTSEVNERFKATRENIDVSKPSVANMKDAYKENDFAGQFSGPANRHHRMACATILNRIFFASCTGICAEEAANANAIAAASAPAKSDARGGAVPGALGGALAGATNDSSSGASGKITPAVAPNSPSNATAPVRTGGSAGGTTSDKSGNERDQATRPTGPSSSSQANTGAQADSKQGQSPSATLRPAVTDDGGTAPSTEPTADKSKPDEKATGVATTCAIAAAPVKQNDVAPPTAPPPATVDAPAPSTPEKPLKDPNMSETRVEKKLESRTNIWPWVIGAGVLACIFWLCKNKKEKSSYVPVPPPLPGKGAETINTNSTTRPSYVR